MAFADPRFSRPERLVFGIGAPKCGTSWLRAQLKAHPSVHIGLTRELNYWNTVRPPHDSKPVDRAREALARLEAGGLLTRLRRYPAWRYWSTANRMRDTADASHSAYADLVFAGYRRQPVAGEVSPGYARLGRDTYAEMAKLAPDVRFVFQMRDPVSWVHSAIRHGLRKRGASSIDEADVIAALRRHSNEAPDFSLLDFDRTITELEAAVDPSRIHFMFFEEMFTQESAGALFRFLGVEHRHVAVEHAVNCGLSTGQPPSEEFVAKVGELYLPVYQFVRARFGEAVPGSWL